MAMDCKGETEGEKMNNCPFCGKKIMQVKEEHGVFYCVHVDAMILFITSDDVTVYNLKVKK